MNAEHIPVFLATDDNYAHLLLTAVLSIADHTKENCDFYILDGGISSAKKTVIEKHLSRLPNVTCRFLSMDERVRQYGFITTGHITMPAYYRFFIADTFPQLDKIIYLDVDVILQSDIKEMFALDLGEYVIGAVKEQTSERNLHVIKSNMQMAEDSVYFNSGVLLMNLALWREKQITARLLEIEKEYHGRLMLNDQDVLNVCFEKNFLNMDLKFNATEKYDFPCVIRHYAGFPKPWEIRPDLCIGEFNEHGFFWDYLRRTEFYDEVLPKCKYCNEGQIRKMAMVKKIMFKQEAKKANE